MERILGGAFKKMIVRRSSILNRLKKIIEEEDLDGESVGERILWSLRIEDLPVRKYTGIRGIRARLCTCILACLHTCIRVYVYTCVLPWVRSPLGRAKERSYM